MWWAAHAFAMLGGGFASENMCLRLLGVSMADLLYEHIAQSRVILIENILHVPTHHTHKHLRLHLEMYIHTYVHGLHLQCFR